MTRLLALGLALWLTTSALAQPKLTREQKVRQDRQKVEAQGLWIYNDLDKAFAEAKKSGKPIIAVLRCIPCEECVKLDDELVDQDERIKPLLPKFVPVRLVSTNNLDLSIFQFDYDQSFAVFFLNADGTIYGRFGTRSHRTHWASDVSVEGLAKAMEAVLKLHEEYPANKAALADKRGPEPLVSAPYKFPNLNEKYGPRLDYEGAVVRSCIHCHQIGDALKAHYHDQGKPMPQKVLFPYPHPKILGLIMDPKTAATVEKVEPGSIAAKAGLRGGDEIIAIDGQPPVSLADIQWVLHNAEETDEIPLSVRRDGTTQDLTLSLPKGWRQQGDISWRATSWPLRRMCFGGMVLKSMSAEERRERGLPATGMALRVDHVGQYGPHAMAKKAGIRKGDIVVAFDGLTEDLRETDLLAHTVNAHKPGDRVSMTLRRGKKELKVTVPIQK